MFTPEAIRIFESNMVLLTTEKPIQNFFKIFFVN